MKKKYIAPTNVMYELCLKESVLYNLSIVKGETLTDDSEWDTQKKHPIWGSESGDRPW